VIDENVSMSCTRHDGTHVVICLCCLLHPRSCEPGEVFFAIVLDIFSTNAV
jgi:hypothetical protein